MRKLLFTFLFLSTFIILEIGACSCENVPQTFSEYMSPSHTIFMGIVLEQIKIPNETNYLFGYHGLTKIQVNKWYQNKMKSDTIYYANGQGAACVSSLEYLKLGEQVIIKASEEDIFDSIIELNLDLDEKLIHFLKNYKNRPIVGYHICDQSVLKVENQLVNGNITKNYTRNRIDKRWSKKLETKLRKTKNEYQSWTLSKFAKLMKKKLKWNL